LQKAEDLQSGGRQADEETDHGWDESEYHGVYQAKTTTEVETVGIAEPRLNREEAKKGHSSSADCYGNTGVGWL
jgi:hypothetical protein